MKMFGERIRENGGHTSGFDYLRIILALSIMCWHSVRVSYGMELVPAIFNGWFGDLILIILPSFFALSGFLVAGSLLRVRSIWIFLGLRGLRILPALCAEILLSAIFIGPLLTSVSLKNYFSDHEFYSYLLNAIGYVHFNLPGLYLENPIPRVVNKSLWTVPFELECYISLFILAVIGFAKRPKIMVLVFITLTWGIMIYQTIEGSDVESLEVAGHRLVLFFIGGVILFLWRDKIPHSVVLLFSSLIVCLLIFHSQRYLYLAPLPVAYVTAYLGLLTPPKVPLLFSGDYSYGIYLYAFPIQQMVTFFQPQGRVWYFNFLLSLIPVCIFAVCSWHFVEKPVLKLKNMLLTRKNVDRERSSCGV